MCRAFLHEYCSFSDHVFGEQIIHTFPGVSAANALHVATQRLILTSMAQPLYEKDMCTICESCCLANIPKCMVQAQVRAAAEGPGREAAEGAGLPGRHCEADRGFRGGGHGSRGG